jgi:hypothetical protein
MAKNTVLSHLNLDLPMTRIIVIIGKANFEYKHPKKIIEEGVSNFRFNSARIEKG